MVNIESLPKVIEFGGVSYTLNLHITAWNKLCVCYKRMFPSEDKFSRYDTIFSQVVEPDIKEILYHSEDPDSVIDVPTMNDAWNVLSARLNTALSNEKVKIETE